jgi:hypothetical protein
VRGYIFVDALCVEQGDNHDALSPSVGRGMEHEVNLKSRLSTERERPKGLVMLKMGSR